MKNLETRRARRSLTTNSALLFVAAVLAAGAALLTLALAADASPASSQDNFGPLLLSSPALPDNQTRQTIGTVCSLAGTPGNNGWFVSAVTVTLEVTGTTENAIIMYRLDGADTITYTQPFVIPDDGVHSVEYYAVANGQPEPPQTLQVRIDTTPPSSSMDLLSDYQVATEISLSWNGSDNGGSGIAGYDIEFKDGSAGAWRTWLTNTTNISATFVGQRGHAYYFRSRAHDIAGNVQEPAPGRGDAWTFIDSITNGDFETGTFDGWTVTGEMSKSITSALQVGASGQWVALLGSPDYGPSITETEEYHVPPDSFAAIAQVVEIPPLADLPAPAMRLWYRIFTYDVVWGCSHPDWLLDSFDIIIRDPSGNILAMPVRDGNYDCGGYNYDTPQLVAISAQRTINLLPYAGRRVIIEMSNNNRRDWFFNTWTYVDDVRIVNQPSYGYSVYLPIIVVNNTMGAPGASPASPGQRRDGSQPRR